MRKIFDAFLGSIKDGIHPREIALAVALGIIAGFVTGWNLTLLVILLAVVLLRVPFQMFGQAWAASAMIAWMMTPATFHTGRYMLEESPMAATFAASADSLTMVLFDFDRYTLLGGLVWGVLLAIPCAWIAMRFSRSLQLRLRKVGEKIKSAGFAVRATCWLMFGSLEGVLQPPKERWIFRPFGAICCLLTIVPMGTMAWMYGPGMMEQSMLHALSRANQAEVSAETFELSLTDGTLHVQNLQIADAGQLDHDRMRIASLTAVLKPAPLLRGRVHVERIVIDGMTCNVPRESIAKAYPIDLPDFDIDPHIHFDGSLEEFGYKLETYARNWLEIKDRMNQAQDMLQRIDALVHSDDDEPAAIEIPAEYQAMRAMHSSFGSPRPNIVVSLVRAKHLPEKWGLGDEAMLEITNMSSQPELLGCPTRVEFAVPDHSVECVAELNYHQQGPHNLHLKLANVSMAELVAWEKLPEMAVSGGTLTFHGHGTFDSHGLEMPLDVHVDQLAMSLPGGTRKLGLPAELWNQGLAQLRGMQLNAKLHGSWESPRLDVDAKGLVAQFQHQLHAAGHAMLASAVDEQVRRGQDWVQEQANEQLARGQQYVDQGRDAANSAIQSGRDAVSGFGQDVQSKLNEANQQIQNAQNNINNQIQDTVNRALGGVQEHEDLANQFLQNRLQGAGDRYGNNRLADAAAGILGAATGNVRQGINHVGANTGHVIDVAGDATNDAMNQAAATNAAAQGTANSGLDAGQNILDTAGQASQNGMQGAVNQANRYAQNLGNAANDAVAQLGPPTVSGGPSQNSGGANVPAQVPQQNSQATNDRYAEYYARSAANQQQNVAANPNTQSQADAGQANSAAPVNSDPGSTNAGPTNSQLAGNQPTTSAPPQQPVEPAALLYPDAMRSARQLPPPAVTVQADRYGSSPGTNGGGVQQTADQTPGMADRYSNYGAGDPQNPYGAGGTQTAQQNVGSGAANRGGPERYADFYGRAETQLDQPPPRVANSQGSMPQGTAMQGTMPQGGASAQRGNPPGPEYYAGANPGATGAPASQGMSNNANQGESRYGAVQDFMEEVGQRSAASVAGRQAPSASGARYPLANNGAVQSGLPKMASSSIASDSGNSQPRMAANQQRPNAAAIPPVGFNRGYVPQEPFTAEEYQALLLMQQQQQQQQLQQTGTATVAQPQQPAQQSSWKKLATTVTGGAKKLWPFGRSDQQEQPAAEVGNTQQQFAGSAYASQGQQQPYGAATTQQQPAPQQAEAPQDPWYKRLFRR